MKGRFVIMKRSKLAYKIALLIVTLLMLPLFLLTRSVVANFSFAKQEEEKKINKFFYGNEPIEIVELKANDSVLEFGQKILATENWLKDFSIKFKNTSGKSIAYLRFDLDFPETKETGAILAFPLSYGINPVVNKNVENKQILKKGEETEVKLSSVALRKVKELIESKQSFSSINKIDVRISFIAFDDGTAWSAGEFRRPDPANPNRFIPVVPNQEEKQQ